MAYTLSNKCTKNLCKLIIKNVVTCFLEHSVEQINDVSMAILTADYCGPI